MASKNAKAKLAAAMAEAQAKAQKAAATTWDPAAFCFPQQMELLSAPERFLTVCGSRRAGKSFTALAAVLTCVLIEGRDALFVATSEKHARKILWKDLANEAPKYGGVPSESDACWTFPNKSTIWFAGLADARQGGRIGRGVKVGLCIVDEANEINSADLESFATEDIKGALVGENGKPNGRLWIMGNPSEFRSGFWFKSHHHPGLRHFEFFGENNPFMRKNFLEAREEEIRLHGIEDPKVQRDWFNKWVASTSSLVVPNFSEANEYTKLPEAPIVSSSLGIDLGWGADPTALVLVATYKGHPGFWVVFEKCLFQPSIEDVEAEIIALNDRYPIDEMWIDPANGGKGYINTYEVKHGWPMRAQAKSDKESRLQIIDGKFRAKRLWVPKDGPTAHECKTVIWDKKAYEAGRKIPATETPNDCLDALQAAVASDDMLACESSAPEVEAARPHADDPELRAELDRLAAEQADPLGSHWLNHT